MKTYTNIPLALTLFALGTAAPKPAAAIPFTNGGQCDDGPPTTTRTSISSRPATSAGLSPVHRSARN